MIRMFVCCITCNCIDLPRFWEPVEDILIGTANAFLQSLAYCLDFNDEICIVDYKVSLVDTERSGMNKNDSS